MTFFWALLWGAVVAGLLIRAVRQFRAYTVVAPDDVVRQAAAPDLRVVVPARNEAGNIGGCVEGLVSQRYPGRWETVVVDDNSTDQTVAVARRTAGERPGFSIVAAGELPAGWTGKPHACWRGASGFRGEWLAFVDADTVASPELFATAVAYAETHGIDMLSLEPEQEMVGFWERVILPAGMFMMAFFATDLRAINDPDCTDAAANGQFILVRRQVYETVGGHAAVAAAISEDTALARRIKAAGYRTMLAGSRDLIRVRMYTRFAEIWEGLSKNAVNVVGSRRAAVRTALQGLGLGWGALLIPLWGALAAGATLPVLLLTVGSLALFATHISGARYFRLPPWYGLLFPLGYTLVAAIVANSLRSYRVGAVRWKGRTYAPCAEEAGSLPRPAVAAGDTRD